MRLYPLFKYELYDFETKLKDYISVLIMKRKC